MLETKYVLIAQSEFMHLRLVMPWAFVVETFLLATMLLLAFVVKTFA